MPIQIGFCNGSNTKLNCLEYHRDSEVNIALDNIILLVGKQQDININNIYDTQNIQAFLLPAGQAVELFATTLHYAPCDAKKDSGFRVAVVLPKGTNTQKPNINILNNQDLLLTAKNKWLLAHENSQEAKSGAKVGLLGENIDIINLI